MPQCWKELPCEEDIDVLGDDVALRHCPAEHKYGTVTTSFSYARYNEDNVLDIADAFTLPGVNQSLFYDYYNI